MPKYKVPCWVPTNINFFIEVEAETPYDALVKTSNLLSSDDPDFEAKLSDLIENGDLEEWDGTVEVSYDITNVEEVTDETPQ